MICTSSMLYFRSLCMCLSANKKVGTGLLCRYSWWAERGVMTGWRWKEKWEKWNGWKKERKAGEERRGDTWAFVTALPALHHWDASALMTSSGWGPGDDVINNQSGGQYGQDSSCGWNSSIFENVFSSSEIKELLSLLCFIPGLF